jgi:hypothetical protein
VLAHLGVDIQHAATVAGIDLELINDPQQQRRLTCLDLLVFTKSGMQVGVAIDRLKPQSKANTKFR